MDAYKAPGPDGFTAWFFQKSWEIVGQSVIEFAMDFYTSGSIPVGCNDTYINLIPKVSYLETFKQLHPIGLCNVTYKLLTKTMANRLREASKKLVGQHQTSFVHGRQISDNICNTPDLPYRTSGESPPHLDWTLSNLGRVHSRCTG